MPAPNEALKAKLMDMINALSEAEGVTADEILGTLNAMPEVDNTRSDADIPAPRTAAVDEDSDAMTEARVKADSAYTAIGRRCPEPFSGERAMDYRKRVLTNIQPLAKDFSNVNIRSVSDAGTLSVLEDQIYKAAKDSVDWAIDNTPGYLHRTVRMDEAGRRITEYHGDPSAWLRAFQTQPRQMVKINTAH